MRGITRGIPIEASSNTTGNSTLRRVFTGPATMHVSGNPCLLRVVQHESEVRPAKSPVTQCFTWPLDEHRAAVECFAPNGHPIACCGHGLIASADWWSERWPGDGVLVMGGNEHPCRNRDDLRWIGFERVELRNVAPPDWLKDVVYPQRLQQCYEAGPGDGYLIAELPRDSDITRLSPPGARLAAESARALLVFAAVDRLRLATETLHLRYFAPQYGTPEDTATGSAMRLLVELNRDKREVLQAVQRSPDGGLLFARRDDEYTWVGGRVEGEKPAQHPAAGHA